MDRECSIWNTLACFLIRIYFRIRSKNSKFQTIRRLFQVVLGTVFGRAPGVHAAFRTFQASGGAGDDEIRGGSGYDVFRFDDRDTGDVTAGPAADEIMDFSSRDTIDLRSVDILFQDFYAWNEPARGGFTVWEANGDSYVTWNTFGGFHEIRLVGYTSPDLLDQIVWYDDDHGSSVNTAETLADGASVTGAIEVDSDSNWFEVSLTAGENHAFDLRGDPSGSGTLADPYLEFYDSEGNLIDWNDDSDTLDSHLVVTAGESGTCYVAAYSYSGAPGTYELSFDETDEEPTTPPIEDALLV